MMRIKRDNNPICRFQALPTDAFASIISVLIIYIFILILSSCKSNNINEEVIIIDVEKNYQEKEIHLNQIADIFYILTEDSLDFLYKGVPQCITANTIVIQDAISSDIMFFSRDGKAMSKFNKLGNGPNEFSYINTMIYDENSDELFIVSGDRILVYSSKGEFIRTISLLEGSLITEIREFDNISFLIYDMAGKYRRNFSIISKEDGRVLKPIELSQNSQLQMYIMEMDGNNLGMTVGPINNIVMHENGFLLTDHSSDTVFLYRRNNSTMPILVRIPQIQEMDPVIYLNTMVETSRYQFFQSVKVKKLNNRLPSVSLVRDKSQNKIYKQKIILSDFPEKKIEITPDCTSRTNDPKMGFFELDIEELHDANERGKLNGNLKKISEHAKRINNNNNVYMFVHFY